MKKMMLIATLVASSQAFAFYDTNNGSYTNNYGSTGDMTGNASGEGEAAFSMDFSYKHRESRNVQIGADHGANAGSYYGYDQPAYSGYAPAVPQQ